jgi:hypothetical protein
MNNRVDKMMPSSVTFIEMVDRARMWRTIAYYYRTSHPHHMCKRRLDTNEDTRCPTCKLYDDAVLIEADVHPNQRKENIDGR